MYNSFHKLCKHLFFLFFLLLSFYAIADHENEAKITLKSTNIHRMTVPIYYQIQQLFEEEFQKKGGSEEQLDILEKYQAKGNKLLDSTIGWSILEPQFVNIYTDSFTEEELKTINAFYQSKTGQKMLSITPQLSFSFSEITQEKINNIAPSIQKLINEMKKEIK